MSKSTLSGKGQTRLILLGILLVLSVLVLGFILSREDAGELASSFGLDHRAYWAAARLLITGGNPYDRLQMLALEQANGFYEPVPLMLWNPPWTMAFFVPLALLPFRISSLCWLAMTAVTALFCGLALWHVLADAEGSHDWLGILAVLAYVPTVQVLKLGQVGFLVLAGITGFLVAVSKKHDFLAGMALTPLLVKPHLTLLLLAAICWWILLKRRWRVALGWLASFTVVNLVIFLLSSTTFSQYLHAESGLPFEWRTATLGVWLRDIFGYEHSWLMFLPSVVGLFLVSLWALFRKGAWDWKRLLPALLLASTVCAPFGWSHDTVTLLPAVILVLVSLPLVKSWHRMLVLVFYGFAQLLMLLQNQLYIDNAVFYWYPLFLAALFFWQQGMVARRSAEVPIR